METDVALQIYLTQEEHSRLYAMKTTKRTWREFLIEPLLKSKTSKSSHFKGTKHRG